MAKLINSTTGKEVKVGDQIISFRDEVYVLKSMSEPHKPSSQGKVYAERVNGGMRRELYPSVFNLKFIDHQFSKPATQLTEIMPKVFFGVVK